MLNAVKIPDGVDDAPIRRGLLERFGIEIGGGLGAFKGKVWRIGLMGYGARPTMCCCCSPPWSNYWPSRDTNSPHGAGVAAANDFSPPQIASRLP